jgi:LDH2 family malate/lactate/ureidoglycolate dehydrogenase
VRERRRIEPDALRAFAAAVFGVCGMEAGPAEAAARSLCHADAVGMDTHGVANLAGLYVPRLRDGRVDPRARPEVVSERGGAALLDGHDGLGLYVGVVALDEAMTRARSHGVGAVAVRRSSHLGPAGYYTARAAEEGMAAIVMSNCGTQRIARPPGGAEPMLGTNPLSAGAPAGELPPYLLDMSTTVVPTGRVRAAVASGERIPEGWLVDDDGRPVTDPAALDEGRGHIQWLGGQPATGAYKGFGLGLLVDVLAGALPGAGVGPLGEPGADDANVGHFVLALDVSAFRPVADFQATMDAMLGAIVGSPPAGGGGRVLYPGHVESDSAAERAERGIPVAPHVVGQLDRLASELGIDPPGWMPATAGASA